MSFDELDSILEEEGAQARGEKDAERPLVVVIEDDARMRESLAFLLGDMYQLILCASAQEGVDAVHDEVSAVVLDVTMKGHDGFWACGEIRKKCPDIPVIFYSAYQDIKDPFDIINEYRPFGYIIKSGNSHKLMGLLETAVQLRRVYLDNKKLIANLKIYRDKNPSKP